MNRHPDGRWHRGLEDQPVEPPCWPQGLHISLEALFLLHPDILMSSISCNCEYFWNYMSLFSEGFFSDPCVTWTCPAPLGIPKLACWPPVYFWDLRVRGSSTGLHETPRQGGCGLGRRGWAGETLTPRVWKLKSQAMVPPAGSSRHTASHLPATRHSSETPGGLSL